MISWLIGNRRGVPPVLAAVALPPASSATAGATTPAIPREPKQIAAAWVKSHYGEPWAGLVGAAESWHYGMDLNLREKVIQFLDFVIGEVSKTDLYKRINP